MTSVIGELLENNAVYGRQRARELPAPPARRVAVVCCMDARIDVHKMLGLQEGDAHVLRNAGGVVTDDVVRSLVLSQRLLGTREVMVIQHTECGLLGLDDHALKKQIEAEVGAPVPFEFGGFHDLDASVGAAVIRLRQDRFLPFTDAIRGFIYDVRSRLLREVAP